MPLSNVSVKLIPIRTVDFHHNVSERNKNILLFRQESEKISWRLKNSDSVSLKSCSDRYNVLKSICERSERVI